MATATALGVKSVPYVIGPEEFLACLPRIIWHLDDPMADAAAVPLWFAAREARKHVKVVLSGEGADELFGGYGVYYQPGLVRAGRALPGWGRATIGRVASELPSGRRGKGLLSRTSTPLRRRYIGNAYVYHGDEARLLARQGNGSEFDVTDPVYRQAAEAGLDDVATMQLVDVNTWLPGDILVKADRMTMAHGLELRTPFLDREVLAVAARLARVEKTAAGTTKFALREAIGELLPQAAAERAKLGFPVPLGSLAPRRHVWFRGAGGPHGADRSVAEQGRRARYPAPLPVRRSRGDLEAGVASGRILAVAPDLRGARLRPGGSRLVGGQGSQGGRGGSRPGAGVGSPGHRGTAGRASDHPQDQRRRGVLQQRRRSRRLPGLDRRPVVRRPGSDHGRRRLPPTTAPRSPGRRPPPIPRFTLLQPEHGGPGGARNRGVERARGEFLAFVDGDDVLPANAYELLLHALEQSGSDFVSGAVFRVGPKGINPSALHSLALKGRQTGTHITRTPRLLYDVSVWNKLFRRSFWDSHELSYPEGVVWEDIRLMTKAHVLARAVDVIPDIVYYWRERAQGRLSITQSRTSIANLRDRMTALDDIDEFIAAHSTASLLRAHQRKALKNDLWLYVQDLHKVTEAYRAEFADLVNGYLDHVRPPGAAQPAGHPQAGLLPGADPGDAAARRAGRLAGGAAGAPGAHDPPLGQAARRPAVP